MEMLVGGPRSVVVKEDPDNITERLTKETRREREEDSNESYVVGLTDNFEKIQ